MSSPYRELSKEEFDDLSGRILYEDNHLIIVNKLPGEIVQGDETGDECLADLLKAFIAFRDSKPGRVYIGIPHRLDRPVGGAVVFTKTSKALERMCAIFRESKVSKTYWALCEGSLPGHEGLLSDFIARDAAKNTAYITKEGNPKAKEAKLRYRLLGRTISYNLVEIELLTGRHHQIRCQLAHIGCPIKGDLKYGARRSNPGGGISLMARRVSFTHPTRNQFIDVCAPVPESWKGVASIVGPDVASSGGDLR